MKTLHKYLTRQVLASLLMTVTVVTFVLLTGNVLKDILYLLISGHARLGTIAKAIVLLIPFVWVFALPIGLLTSTLLVFGRFSADQELTAARASGISLISLIMPILLLSIFCCVLSAWFSMDLGPRSRVEYLGMRSELLANLVNFQFPEGRFMDISTNYIVYTEKNHNGKLDNVVVISVDHNMYVEAPHGDVTFDATNQQYMLNLLQARMVMTPTNGENNIMSFAKCSVPVNLNSIKKQGPPGISDMTFIDLLDKLHQLQQRIPQTVSTNQTQATLEAARKLPENLVEQVRVVMQRQLALSFAPFGFALVGIPLGIRVQRRETNIGVAVALVLVLVYYSFVILAQQLSARPECYPHLIVWVPDLIFQATGAFLLWRANRGV